MGFVRLGCAAAASGAVRWLPPGSAWGITVRRQRRTALEKRNKRRAGRDHLDGSPRSQAASPAGWEPAAARRSLPGHAAKRIARRAGRLNLALSTPVFGVTPRVASPAP